MGNKIFVFFTCVILFITPALFSSEKFKVDGEAEFEFNDSHIVADQFFTNYDIKGKIGLGFLLTKQWEIFLEVELDKYELDVEEISVKFSWIKNATHSIRAGRFEGDLVLNDFLKKRYELFSLKTPGVKYIEDLGYENFNTGIEYKAENFIWSEFDMSFSFFFNAAHSEPQFIFSGIYNIDESLHFVALTASYLPYVKHQVALGGGAENQFNNILFDLKYYKYGESIVLAGEAAFGKNLIDRSGWLASVSWK